MTSFGVYTITNNYYEFLINNAYNNYKCIRKGVYTD